MTKQELLKALAPLNNDDVVICRDESGGWDNIETVTQEGATIVIDFGGGSPFSGE
jgi:hypothetical protein